MLKAYLTHSYRINDINFNLALWERISRKNFSFSFDPPSDQHQTAHLEKRMLESSCFLAIVPFRQDAPEFFCSPFMMYEIGLAIQARRPKLIVIDDRIPEDTPIFANLRENERIRLNPTNLAEFDDELENKLELLRKRALPAEAVSGRAARRIGYFVDPEFAGGACIANILGAADKTNFTPQDLRSAEHRHNAALFQKIDSCDAVVFDARDNSLPNWISACLLVRPAPTIKIVHLRPNEQIDEVQLHPMIQGARMDSREPIPEHILFWRHPEELFGQLVEIMQIINEDAPSLIEEKGGIGYFSAIGRRSSKLFVSNSGALKEFSKDFTDDLSINNLRYFQYKRNIVSGENWKERLKEELDLCDGFVAFIDKDYMNSEWCQMELRHAVERFRNEGEKFLFLPYNVDGVSGTKLYEILESINVEDLDINNDGSRKGVIRRINQALRSPDSQDVGPLRSLLPGGTREIFIDVLRQLPPSTLKKIVGYLPISSSALRRLRAPGYPGGILSRLSAEKILDALHRDDTRFAKSVLNEHPLLTFCNMIKEDQNHGFNRQCQVLTQRLGELEIVDDN